MKKFTDKQLREEIDGLREQAQSFPDIRMRPVGMLLHADMIEFLMKRNAAEREDQHRKTWALAMESAANACWPCQQDYAPSIPTEHVAKRLGDYIRKIDCPPIDNIKL